MHQGNILKALFALKNVSTNEILKSPTFENKPDAKAERDRRWKAAGSPMTDVKDPQPAFPFVVTAGPDHDLHNPYAPAMKQLPIAKSKKKSEEVTTA
jgi:hypothetical protein